MEQEIFRGPDFVDASQMHSKTRDKEIIGAADAVECDSLQ